MSITLNQIDEVYFQGKIVRLKSAILLVDDYLLRSVGDGNRKIVYNFNYYTLNVDDILSDILDHYITLGFNVKLSDKTFFFKLKDDITPPKPIPPSNRLMGDSGIYFIKSIKKFWAWLNYET